MDLFNYMSELRYGRVHLAHDEASGLKAIVAVHNTRRGPGIGGTRFIPYQDSNAAIRDAMRLARGMSYKAAGANLDHGGGKAVIVYPDKPFNREALFTAFAKFVDSLGGDYITCEDSGTGTADMDVVARHTKHVLGTSQGSGDPSPFTAFGCRRGVEAAVRFQLGRTDLAGLHCAIQGVGHVGYYMAKELHELGMRLTVADINPEATARCEREFGAKVVNVNDILATECDVLAPCALGAVFNDDSIAKLRTRIIAGAANNVLAEDRHGWDLWKKGILYAPDYIINAGGLINVATEYGGYSESKSRAKVSEIFDTLTEMFERSRKTETPMHVVADRYAEERIFG